MDESDLTEDLDKRGLLDTSRQPGCYALQVETPDDADEIRQRWLNQWDADPENAEPERLAQSSNVAYVGAAHSSIYSRLCDHVAGDVRKAGFLALFPPDRVATIWPDANPDTDEYTTAREMTRFGWVCWTDGVLVE